MAVPSHKSYLKALSTAIDLFWEGEKTSAIHIFKKAELELELSLGKVKTDEYLIGLEGLPKKWRDSLKNLLPKTKPTSSMEYFQEMKPKEDSFQASESDILLPDELLPEEELQIVLSLYKEDKILEAIDLLNSLKEKYQKDFEDNESIRNLISDYQIINEIYNNVQDKQNWTISKTGKVNVMYKKLENTKSYSVLAEGLIKAPLFNFISIIYENDLYHTWLPYCQSSSTISNLSKTRKIIFQEFDLPFLSSRHACLYAFGANLLQSKGVIVIASKSCDQQKSYKGIDLPQNLESKKAQVNIMGFIVKPLSEQEIHVTFLMNFDPILKSFTYKILNYFSRKISRAIFSKLGKLCKNFKGSLFETQLKAPENQEFYDYLNESLEEYLKSEVSK